ncbi:MAG: nucleotidyltransferase family protein [Anaerolineae bacterium]|nr:nucleotidyltransferase family protein [Anaerolineae bacterium]
MSPVSPLIATFLRTALRSRFDPTAADAAAELAARPDFRWDTALAVAAGQGVLPLLYATLAPCSWLPESARAPLREAYTSTALHNRLFLNELGRVLPLLDSHGVDVILLKGVALVAGLYGDPGLRPMADLDLLVRPAAAATAMAVLQDASYHPLEDEVVPGATLAYESQVVLLKSHPVPIGIELHWHLLDSPHYQRLVDMDWFWQTRQPVAGFTADVLGPEAQLLHLCAHLWLHHRGQGLLWQFDIVALLAAAALDWQTILDRARAYDLVLSTRHVLIGLAQHWQAPVPPSVLAQLRELAPSAAERRLVTRLTAPHRPVWQRFWTDLMAMDAWSSRLRYAWINLFPSPAYMRHRYEISHPYLLPLYYPYRWYRGLRGLVRPPKRP